MFVGLQASRSIARRAKIRRRAHGVNKHVFDFDFQFCCNVWNGKHPFHRLSVGSVVFALNAGDSSVITWLVSMQIIFSPKNSFLVYIHNVKSCLALVAYMHMCAREKCLVAIFIFPQFTKSVVNIFGDLGFAAYLVSNLGRHSVHDVWIDFFSKLPKFLEDENERTAETRNSNDWSIRHFNVEQIHRIYKTCFVAFKWKFSLGVFS